jgi:hypothetical protein
MRHRVGSTSRPSNNNFRAVLLLSFCSPSVQQRIGRSSANHPWTCNGCSSPVGAYQIELPENLFGCFLAIEFLYQLLAWFGAVLSYQALEIVSDARNDLLATVITSNCLQLLE